MSSSARAIQHAKKIIEDHGDFRLTGSLESAGKYLAALDTLIPLTPQQTQIGGNAGESVMWSHKSLLEMQSRAQKWVNAKRQVNQGRNVLLRYCRK